MTDESKNQICISIIRDAIRKRKLAMQLYEKEINLLEKCAILVETDKAFIDEEHLRQMLRDDVYHMEKK